MSYGNTKTYAEYLAELSDLVDATGDPALTEVQLARVLSNARIADPNGYPPDTFTSWTPETEVAPNAVRVPTVRDGFVYYTPDGGTTGLLEPVFGVTTPLDGDVEWVQYGVAPWGAYYDLNRAASDGWRLKQAKASKRKDVQAFGQTNARTSTYEHCKEQADYYASLITATVSVVSPARRAIY